MKDVIDLRELEPGVYGRPDWRYYAWRIYEGTVTLMLGGAIMLNIATLIKLAEGWLRIW